MLEAIVGGVLIFLLRLGDVPIGTVRTMLMVQGRKLPVALLAVCESTIWVLAITRVLSGGALDDPYRVAGYALGFATGTVVGMTIEEWLAFGKVMARVITSQAEELRPRLLEAGYGVTIVRGEGKGGEVGILFVVSLRRRQRHLLKIIQDVDPQAFITIDLVGEAIGGYVRAPKSLEGHRR